jgi:hypothetical protein
MLIVGSFRLLAVLERSSLPREIHATVRHQVDLAADSRCESEIGEPRYSDMQSEKACDYNNHDDYTDNVENIHWFAPIKYELDRVCIGKKIEGRRAHKVQATLVNAIGVF